MKKNKSKILFLVGCVLGIILQINIVYASGLKLNKSKVQLLVGEKVTIEAIPGNSNVKWSSSNPQIVSVNSKGKNGSLKARKSGKVTIYAKYKGRKVKCIVTVKKPVVKRKAIKGSWVIDSQLTMAKNKTSMFRTISGNPRQFNYRDESAGLCVSAQKIQQQKFISYIS